MGSCMWSRFMAAQFRFDCLANLHREKALNDLCLTRHYRRSLAGGEAAAAAAAARAAAAVGLAAPGRAAAAAAAPRPLRWAAPSLGERCTGSFGPALEPPCAAIPAAHVLCWAVMLQILDVHGYIHVILVWHANRLPLVCLLRQVVVCKLCDHGPVEKDVCWSHLSSLCVHCNCSSWSSSIRY